MTDKGVLGLRRPRLAAAQLVWLPLLVAGTAWLTLRSVDWEAPLWQLWLLALVIVAAATLSAPLGSPYLEQDDLLPVHAEPGAARSFGSVTRWESRLSGQRDVEDFHRVVQQNLILVIAERLRLRHGVELAHDGPRARQLLGDELYRFCVRPVAVAPSRAELERLITRIERI